MTARPAVPVALRPAAPAPAGPPPRRGFTLVEVLVVMAVLVILAAVILPSVGAFRGDSRPQAAVDLLRGELADARGRAKLENRPYRVAVGSNGTRLRRAPDGPEFAEAAAYDRPDGTSAAVEYALEHAVVELLSDPSAAAGADGADGWQTVAVVLPDGTCLDDSITVGVREADAPAGAGSLRVHIRGLTGTARVVTGAPEAKK